jgi:two-component system, sensor histidine kinase PdtaS
MRYRPDHGDFFIEAGIGWKPGLVGVMGIGIDSASPAGRALQTNLPVADEFPLTG